jgi:hypothetical protein
MTLKSSIKSFCLIVIISGIACIVTYLMLHWFHTSWDTGVPVLDAFTPLISFIVAIGSRLPAMLSLKWVVPSMLGVFLIVGSLGAVLHRRCPSFLIILSFCVLVLAFLFLAAGKYAGCYITLGAALLPLLIHAFLVRRQPTPRVDRKESRDAVFFAIVLCVAVIFRFYHLDVKPVGILNESAGNAYMMRHYVTGSQSLFHDHWQRNTPMSWNGNVAVAACVLTFKLFGVSPLAYKFVPAFSAVIAVVALFFLTRYLFGGRTAFLASLFLATSVWNTFSSRDNIPQLSLAISQSILTYLVLVYAFKKRSYLLFALLGVLTGLSVYVYAPGKATCIGAALFAASFLLGALIKDHRLRNVLRHAAFMLICCAAFSVTVSSYVRWGLDNRAYFYSAAGDNNLRKAYWEREGNEDERTASEHVRDGLKYVWPVLVHDRGLRTDGADAYARNASKGTVNPVIAVFFAFGLWWCVAHVNRRECVFLLVWTAVGIIPAVLTEPMPKRLSMVVPALYVAAGLGAERLWYSLGRFSPKIIGNFLLPIIVGILSFGLICYNAYEYFEVSKYGGVSRPSIVQNRHALYRAADETVMITDINSSLLGLVMAEHGDYKMIRDLGKEKLKMLEKAQGLERPLTIVALNSKNEELLEAWRALTHDHQVLKTDYFTMLTLGRRGLDELFQFSPAQLMENQSYGEATRYAYRASLVVRRLEKIGITFSKPFPDSVFIDGEQQILTPGSQGKRRTDKWLSAGAHLLEVVNTSGVASPLLSFERAEESKDALPFICLESVHKIPSFSAIATRSTALTWPLASTVTLEKSDELIRPMSMTPGSDGLVYVTDSSTGAVYSFEHDGSLKMKMELPVSFTMNRSLLAPDGNIYIVRPISSRCVVKFDRTGKFIKDYPVSAVDMCLSYDGGFYAIHKDWVRMYSPSDDGELTQTTRASSHKLPKESFVSVNVGPGDDLYILTSNGEVHAFDKTAKKKSTISLGRNAANMKSRLAVDRGGLIYVTDYDNDRVRMFDQEGNMLVGNAESNSPIKVKTPIDVAIWDGRVIVLSKHRNKDYRLYSYRIPVPK